MSGLIEGGGVGVGMVVVVVFGELWLVVVVGLCVVLFHPYPHSEPRSNHQSYRYDDRD